MFQIENIQLASANSVFPTSNSNAIYPNINLGYQPMQTASISNQLPPPLPPADSTLIPSIPSYNFNNELPPSNFPLPTLPSSTYNNMLPLPLTSLPSSNYNNQFY